MFFEKFREATYCHKFAEMQQLYDKNQNIISAMKNDKMEWLNIKRDLLWKSLYYGEIDIVIWLHHHFHFTIHDIIGQTLNESSYNFGFAAAFKGKAQKSMRWLLDTFGSAAWVNVSGEYGQRHVLDELERWYYKQDHHKKELQEMIKIAEEVKKEWEK